MTENRRILIHSDRIKCKKTNVSEIIINNKEEHYLRNVLRLKEGGLVDIIDGIGNLWQASITNKNKLLISSTISNPFLSEPRPKRSTGLAISLPKKGFEDLLRMCTEIGIDFIQPIVSDRTTPQANDKFDRWDRILNEAVEQSERLWKPKIFKTIDFKNWCKNKEIKNSYSLAITRETNIISLESWILDRNLISDQIWVAIGPEGGWSNQELILAKKSDFTLVCLGNSILRSSTAAVVATQIMISSRIR